MDFVRPISPRSQGGNWYILTVSDYSTKFTRAKGMPTKEPVNVVSTLSEVSTAPGVSYLQFLMYHPSALMYLPAFLYCNIPGPLLLFCTNSNRKLGGAWGWDYLPSVMTTDQGREICNHVNKELINVFRIQHRLTTVSHPQPNGLDEWLNQITGNSSAKLAQKLRNMGCETAWGCVRIQHSCTRIYKAHTIWSNIQKNGSPACQLQCL